MSCKCSLKILNLLQEESMTAFSAFPEAFGQLTFRQWTDLPSPLETDGKFLFYDPVLLCRCFLDDPNRLRLGWLHIHLHCLCLHQRVPKAPSAADFASAGTIREKTFWNMACDLSAAWFTDALLTSADTKTGSHFLVGYTERSDQFREHGLPASVWADPEALLPYLKTSPALRQLARTCALDTHCFWYPKEKPDNTSEGRASADTVLETSRSSDKQKELQTYVRRWEQIRQKLTETMSDGSGKHSLQSGNAAEKADLKRRDSMDYHQFLQRFMIPREEAILDMDSFDYIPYHYGSIFQTNTGTRSFSPVFLEPLEYKEVNRLDELAIAIDTSCSCSGQIVRRFLEETWNILRQKENFFSKMRLHLIQCDSMIQEHRIFTSTEEWEAAIPDFQIRGLGNTDFRPVFQYLDQLIQKKEIRCLRGLLYFSDGDGIYPRSRPSYDTAFIFLKEPDEKLKIPDWIIRLSLNLPDDLL